MGEEAGGHANAKRGRTDVEITALIGNTDLSKRFLERHQRFRLVHSWPTYAKKILEMGVPAKCAVVVVQRMHDGALTRDPRVHSLHSGNCHTPLFDGTYLNTWVALWQARTDWYGYVYPFSICVYIQ